MAGDWIKMRSNLWDDPRVARICTITGQNEATIIGGLFWLWTVADQHSVDGHLVGLDDASIDRKSRIDGFSSALQSVEWLEKNDDGVTVPRFDEHNGASAKRRALDASRKATVRNASAKRPHGERTKSGHDAELEKEKERENKKRDTASNVSNSKSPVDNAQNARAPGDESQNPPSQETLLETMAIAAVCEESGIHAGGDHPVVTRWVLDGFNAQDVRIAIAIAKGRKQTATVPIGYLDPIVRDQARSSSTSWQTDDRKAADLAASLGIASAKAGEGRSEFHARILEALANARPRAKAAA